MRRVDALEAWKCFGAQSAVMVSSEDLREPFRLVDFGRKIGAVVKIEPGNEEIIFLQSTERDQARQRAFKLDELKKISFRDL